MAPRVLPSPAEFDEFPRMEQLGLDPANMADLEIYDVYLEAAINAHVERDLAEEQILVDVYHAAEEHILNAMESTAYIADPGEADRVVTEAQREADEFIADRLPDHLLPAARQPRLEPLPLLSIAKVRARAREPRRRNVRRQPRRARAPNCPRPSDDDPDPAGRALARLVGVEATA
jgi:hypothetical protein